MTKAILLINNFIEIDEYLYRIDIFNNSVSKKKQNKQHLYEQQKKKNVISNIQIKRLSI